MIPQNIVRQIAKRVGIGEPIGKRLLGSSPVSFVRDEVKGDVTGVDPAVVSFKGQIITYDLGLRLDRFRVKGGWELHSDLVLKTLTDSLNSYRQTSPLVFNWQANGGFNPRRIPEVLNASKLKHGSRTVQRIRAKALRRLAGITLDFEENS